MDLQITIERIKSQCRKQNISINEMLLSCGLTKNIVDNMKKGSVPSIDKISIIADRLDCTIDYLVGRVDNPSFQVITAPAGTGADAVGGIKGIPIDWTPEKIEELKRFVEHLRE